MKITPSTYNPLSRILRLFVPMEQVDSSDFLTREVLEKVDTELFLGGVYCENLSEVLDCIKILAQQGVLCITEHTIDKSTYLKVTRVYG